MIAKHKENKEMGRCFVTQLVETTTTSLYVDVRFLTHHKGAYELQYIDGFKFEMACMYTQGCQ